MVEEIKEPSFGFMYGDVNQDVDEYNKDRLRWLAALEKAGVNKWEGIKRAREIYLAFKR